MRHLSPPVSFFSLVPLPFSFTSDFFFGFLFLVFHLAFVLRIAITIMSSHLLYRGVWEERLGRSDWTKQNGCLFLFIYLGFYSG